MYNMHGKLHSPDGAAEPEGGMMSRLRNVTYLLGATPNNLLPLLPHPFHFVLF